MLIKVTEESLPATPEHSTAYTYDSVGRLNTVSDGSDTFTYGYLANSGILIETVTGPAHTVSKNYEAHRNVLSNLSNTAGATVQSNYAYTVNNLGQRTNLTTSGDAFTTAPVYTWQYNARGELVQADDSSTADQDRAYQYDGIGNRQKTANGLLVSLPASNNYAANSLNQYTTITSAGTNLAPSYDLDGNATAYPVPASPGANASLLWDAENRLVLTTVAGTTTRYRYDYLSRRMSKQIGTAALQHYLYDGWNLLAEYTGSALAKRYTWGMDLSGSMQGAGGVGGLLSVHDASDTYYPTYDGNGNVSEYLDTFGTVAAHYEYDAFGNTTVATGSRKDDFSHRFSTKPLDAETGLYYYGYRYYDPVMGRWPSRDPIEEDGGVNLYEIVGNDVVNSWDLLGLKKCDPPEVKDPDAIDRCDRDLAQCNGDAEDDLARRSAGCALAGILGTIFGTPLAGTAAFAACKGAAVIDYNVEKKRCEREHDDCIDDAPCICLIF